MFINDEGKIAKMYTMIQGVSDVEHAWEVVLAYVREKLFLTSVCSFWWDLGKNFETSLVDFEHILRPKRQIDTTVASTSAYTLKIHVIWIQIYHKPYQVLDR
jgi:hypothetical protein